MSNEVIEKGQTALVTPSQPQRGFEGGIDREDLIIPRAKLIQALSPELTEGLDGIKIGTIINSLTKEILPQEFIPIFTFKNFIRFNPRSKDDPNFDTDFDPGGVIWKSSDPSDPKVKAEACFGPNGEKPLAITFINFFSYFPGVSMPIIVSFSKTGYKTGKNLLSLAKFCGGDMFARKYRLFSQMETNDVATYAVLKVKPVGSVVPEEFQLCEQLWNEFSAKAAVIQVHDEEVQDDPSDKKPF